jgi:tetrahydromethanopterin S-methyltransferase subunit A
MERLRAKDFEVINVPKFNEIEETKLDKSCYVLIKIYRETKEIGVAICNYNDIILKEFRGRKALDIYEEIFKGNYITSLSHAAYLGKELKKAEIALEMSSEYHQE